MADRYHKNTSKRGLAMADEATRKRVAQAGGRASAQKMSAEQRSRIGQEGGRARMQQMDEQERREFAAMGGRASRGGGRRNNEDE